MPVYINLRYELEIMRSLTFKVSTMSPSRSRKKFFKKVYRMNDNIPPEVTNLDEALRDFSMEIKPDESTLKAYNRFAQTIADVLKKESNFKIARFSFAGSFGKRTNIQKSDVDCVYFINDIHPPFDDVFEEFYNICNQSSIKKHFNTLSIKLNKNSINFKTKSLEMDVVLATNFVKKTRKNKCARHRQHICTLEYIKLNPVKNCYVYSAALAEATVYFMKTRVGFANEMARLAKFWFKKLDEANQFEHISGANTFIELVAVFTARKGRRRNNKYNSHLKAFIRFLESLTKFHKLDVEFGKYNPIFQGHQVANSDLPRVIDPVNPYNDFARYWRENKKAIEVLKNCAARTYSRLQDVILYPSGTDLIEYLFS